MTIDINKGEHSPADMVGLLNDQLSENQNRDTDFAIADLVDSPYLKTTANAVVDPSANRVINITDIEHEAPWRGNA